MDEGCPMIQLHHRPADVALMLWRRCDSRVRRDPSVHPLSHDHRQGTTQQSGPVPVTGSDLVW